MLIKNSIKTFIIFLISQFLFLYFANGKEAESNPNFAPESNRIAVIVNKYLKQEIEANLNIYLEDLRNEGYDPVLKEWDLENNPAPAALRTWLKGVRDLQGAVLIGDLPIPYVKAHSVLNKWGVTDRYIAEMYYMDFTKRNWMGEDNDSQFFGAGIPQIWTSRIITSPLLGWFGVYSKNTEAELVNSYLEKNHAYRTGKVVFPRQNLLYSIPESMKDDKVFFGRDPLAREILSKSSSLLKETNPEYVSEFFEPLAIDAYEILFWSRHGMPTFIHFGNPFKDLRTIIQERGPRFLTEKLIPLSYNIRLTSRILAQVDVNIATAFVFPTSCWIGHYATPGYFGGTYIFNKKFFNLGMPTATLPTSNSGRGRTMNAMSNFVDGNNLGQAYKLNFFDLPEDSINSINNDLLSAPDDDILLLHTASHNSKYIIGDGTLRLQSRYLIPTKENSPVEYLKRQNKIDEQSVNMPESNEKLL